MAKTLLQIVQSVTQELLLNSPNSVLSNTDKTVKQFNALVVAACDELLDMYDWQQLTVKQTITTVPSVALYPIPADYQRYVSDTAWDKSNAWPMAGSFNPQDWQTLTSGIVQTGPYTDYRLNLNKIELLPTPQGALDLSIVYISNYYVINGVTGLPQPTFQNDSDTTLFQDRLLINFTKLKWLQTKGFDTTAATQDFNSSLAMAKGSNVPSPSLMMAPTFNDYLVGVLNVPDGNYGGAV